jgi:hypothetical protein
MRRQTLDQRHSTAGASSTQNPDRPAPASSSKRRRRDNKALMDKLAALEDHVIQLETELAVSPQPAPMKPPGRNVVAALKR